VLDVIRHAVLTALKLHNAWSVNGEFRIRKSVLFQAAQVSHNGITNKERWDPWIKIDTEGQIFLHNDMPNRISIRSIRNGLVLWTIHTRGVVQVIKSAKLENRTFILAHIEYDGDDV
jgi:hypothetical protein